MLQTTERGHLNVQTEFALLCVSIKSKNAAITNGPLKMLVYLNRHMVFPRDRKQFTAPSIALEVLQKMALARIML